MLARQGAQPRQGRTTHPNKTMLEVYNQDKVHNQDNPTPYKRSLRNVRGIQPRQGA